MKRLFKILLSALTAAAMLINIMPVVSMAEENVIIDGNKATRVFWNLDFDDGRTYVAGAGSSLYDIAYKDGESTVKLMSETGSNSLRCDYGDFEFAENSATDVNYGTSLRMTSNGSGQNGHANSLFEFQASPDSNMIVWSYDYCVSDMGVNRDIAVPRYVNTSGSTPDFAPLGMSQGGRLKSGNNPSYWTDISGVSNLQPNTWYNIKYVIDATEKPVAKWQLYVDNVAVPDMKGELTDFAKMKRVTITDWTASTGCVTWVDNIKVYEYAKPLTITSVESGDKYLDITLSEKVAAFESGNVDGISITYGSNKLTPISCEYVDTNTLRVTTLEDIFTSVDMTVSVYDSINDREASCLYKKSAKSVDVESVTFTPVEGNVSVSADIAVEDGSSLDVCMLLVLKNADGATVKLVKSDCLTLTSDDTITLSGYHSDAAKAEIIFIDNLTDCRPIKNLKYEKALD